jgi:hypothetical protein
MSVPIAGLSGSGFSVGPNTMSPPMPAVRLSTDIDLGLADALGHLAIKCDIATRAPVSGSRTWQWTIAAPALAASMARIGDLLGRARHMRTAVLGGAGSGDGAGDEHLAVHGQGHAANPPLLGPPMMTGLQPHAFHFTKII